MLSHARVLVTVLDTIPDADAERADQLRKRLSQTRGAWGKRTDLAELDKEIEALRDEWQRPWDSTETTADP